MQFDGPHIIAALTTAGLVIVCVLFPYDGLSRLSRWITFERFQPRPRIAVLIFGQLILHVCEIWFFAFGYFLLSANPDFGTFHQAPYNTITSPLEMNLGDQVYYSATVYTTLGFGDIVPGGPLRFLTGVEAVVGLVLITWSASFTFLEMQRYWGRG